MSGEVAAVDRTPVQNGPVGSHAVSGPFTPAQLARIDNALTLSSEDSGLTFSVFVGDLGSASRDAAEGHFSSLAATAANPVLIALSPDQKVVHVVTGEQSAQRLPNRACALAVLAMRSSFANGDLTGGIVTGLRMLADSAGRI